MAFTVKRRHRRYTAQDCNAPYNQTVQIMSTDKSADQYAKTLVLDNPPNFKPEEDDATTAEKTPEDDTVRQPLPGFDDTGWLT